MCRCCIGGKSRKEASVHDDTPLLLRKLVRRLATSSLNRGRLLGVPANGKQCQAAILSASQAVRQREMGQALPRVVRRPTLHRSRLEDLRRAQGASARAQACGELSPGDGTAALSLRVDEDSPKIYACQGDKATLELESTTFVWRET